KPPQRIDPTCTGKHTAMKAIIRSGAGLLGLLLLSVPGLAQDRIWVSAVLRQPLPYAPSPCNSGFYYVDAYGRLCGPHYGNLTPPFPMHAPYAMPMPYAAPPVANSPGSPYPPMRTVGYVPYVGTPGMYQLASRNPQTGVWQVQNVMPRQAAPFAPIPGFRPGPA